jgi:hypothetical protein
MRKAKISGIKKNKLWTLLLNITHFIVNFSYSIFQILCSNRNITTVNFTQRTSTATPAKKIYNIKGDFTMLGNTNLTLATYGDNIDNQNNYMKFVDTVTTLLFNSSKATLELSNTRENSSIKIVPPCFCSTILDRKIRWCGYLTTKQKKAGTKSVNANSTVKSQSKYPRL